MARIVRCSCISDYQDKKYGKDKRVYNSCGRAGDKFRCTVCSKEVDRADAKK